ncbi:unnamed protein product [Choristocarpus tenellus]
MSPSTGFESPGLGVALQERGELAQRRYRRFVRPSKSLDDHAPHDPSISHMGTLRRPIPRTGSSVVDSYGSTGLQYSMERLYGQPSDHDGLYSGERQPSAREHGWERETQRVPIPRSASAVSTVAPSRGFKTITWTETANADATVPVIYEEDDEATDGRRLSLPQYPSRPLRNTVKVDAPPILRSVTSGDAWGSQYSNAQQAATAKLASETAAVSVSSGSSPSTIKGLGLTGRGRWGSGDLDAESDSAITFERSLSETSLPSLLGWKFAGSMPSDSTRSGLGDTPEPLNQNLKGKGVAAISNKWTDRRHSSEARPKRGNPHGLAPISMQGSNIFSTVAESTPERREALVKSMGIECGGRQLPNDDTHIVAEKSLSDTSVISSAHGRPEIVRNVKVKAVNDEKVKEEDGVLGGSVVAISRLCAAAGGKGKGMTVYKHKRAGGGKSRKFLKYDRAAGVITWTATRPPFSKTSIKLKEVKEISRDSRVVKVVITDQEPVQFETDNLTDAIILESGLRASLLKPPQPSSMAGVGRRGEFHVPQKQAGDSRSSFTSSNASTIVASPVAVVATPTNPTGSPATGQAHVNGQSATSVVRRSRNSLPSRSTGETPSRLAPRNDTFLTPPSQNGLSADNRPARNGDRHILSAMPRQDAMRAKEQQRPLSSVPKRLQVVDRQDSRVSDGSVTGGEVMLKRSLSESSLLESSYSPKGNVVSAYEIESIPNTEHTVVPSPSLLSAEDSVALRRLCLAAPAKGKGMAVYKRKAGKEGRMGRRILRFDGAAGVLSWAAPLPPFGRTRVQARDILGAVRAGRIITLTLSDREPVIFETDQLSETMILEGGLSAIARVALR